jgi:hypothetical protein
MDIWASNSKQSKDTNDIPNGLMPDLLKVIEKYKLDGKRLICLFDSNGQVNASMIDIAARVAFADLIYAQRITQRCRAKYEITYPRQLVLITKTIRRLSM